MTHVFSPFAAPKRHTSHAFPCDVCPFPTSVFSTPFNTSMGGCGGAFCDVCRFMTSVDLQIRADVCLLKNDRRQIRQTSPSTDVCLFACCFGRLTSVLSAEKTYVTGQQDVGCGRRRLSICDSDVCLFHKKDIRHMMLSRSQKDIRRLRGATACNICETDVRLLR